MPWTCGFGSSPDSRSPCRAVALSARCHAAAAAATNLLDLPLHDLMAVKLMQSGERQMQDSGRGVGVGEGQQPAVSTLGQGMWYKPTLVSHGAASEQPLVCLQRVTTAAPTQSDTATQNRRHLHPIGK